MSKIGRKSHVMLTAGAVVAVLITVLVAVFVTDAPPSSRVPVSPSDSPSRLVDVLHARFDPAFPGRGVTDYPGNTEEHIPKAYAMILLAEIERGRHGIESDLPDLGTSAGRWLLDNAELDAQGATGWGVPVAWDAYGDESVNPANTVYSISTGIVADALLTWMETDPDAPGQEIIATVSSALDGFAQAPKTPDGLIAYSLESPDQPYDTFNSAAYLAGQMQRFAKYADDPALAARLRSTADATVASLVRHHQISPSKSWYWRYSIQEDVTNDLAHAGYIVEGLRTYVRERGRLSPDVDLPAVVSHLRDFFDETGTPRGWPDFQTDIDRGARLYDIGMALHLSCSEPRLAPLTDKLTKVVDNYRAGESGFSRYPAGTPDEAPLVVNEYEAYLWRGLMSCRSKESTGPGLDKLRSPRPSGAAPARLPGSTVPLVRIGSGATRSGVSFDGERSSLRLPWSPARRVAEDGLILEAIDDGAGGVLITRGHPRNDLTVVTLDESGRRRGRLTIRSSPGSAPMLRAAAFHRGALHVVYYDNPSLTNYLARYRRRPGGYVRQGEPVALPTLEDPAGLTYEMIPALSLVAAKDQLHLIGGTLSATVNEDGSMTSSRVPNCLRVLEAVALPRGPVVLCLQKRELGVSAPFELHGPEGVRLPRLGGGGGVPFGLGVVDGNVRIKVADTPRGLAAMLRFDLQRANSGWLEYGTDNVEGRVAWSQIYYLNGFLDFLLLAGGDKQDWRMFSSLLEQMRARLDQELVMADRHWRSGRYETRAFTVDRSRALFAVQTSRLLLLMERYTDELRDPAGLPGHRELRAAVTRLTDHIEVLAREGQEPHWLPSGVPYLRWPQGSAFSFDGLNVPYNHQNEWAYALLRSGTNERAEATAQGIVAHFLRHVAPDGRLPHTGSWDYWWGQAYDGWTEADDVSDNKPAYDGDRIEAWISFRSIDAMSALAAAPMLDPVTRLHLRSSAASLVREGKLYPFVGYELRRAGVELDLPSAVARRHIRVSSPWELQNAAWAYSAELTRLAGKKR
ncbi:hypothetical protein [Nocardioides sp.]|uniref:hypothetical protein n=1 Tax=Nocardioides sp. TaxID=35761 RepID=UPI002B73F82C|nr:hypothetical protein [Nocardioides sp.]HXH80910.1 hypothetical protein [Nocardioides sp.]